MKIAFICELVNTQRQGGEQHAMLRLANSLAAKADVDFYSYQPTQGQKRIASHIPMKLRLAPFVRDIVVVPFVGCKLLRRITNQYDIISASSTTIASFYSKVDNLIITCHAIRSQKVAVLATIPKYKLYFNPLTRKILAFLERRSMMHAAAVIVLHRHQRDYLVHQLGIASNKIHIIPNGIDTDLFRPLNTKKKNQIIFVGRGTVPKGLDVLLDSAPNLNCELLVVTQKIDPNLLSRAENIANVRIIMKATPKQLVRLYSESKAFILPSRDEEQPLTILEAMACELPLIISKPAAANVAELNHGNNHILAKITAADIIKSYSDLLEQEHADKSKANRQDVLRHYALSNIAERTLTLMASVAS